MISIQNSIRFSFFPLKQRRFAKKELGSSPVSRRDKKNAVNTAFSCFSLILQGKTHGKNFTENGKIFPFLEDIFRVFPYEIPYAVLLFASHYDILIT